MKISSIFFREILNSFAKPSVEAEVNCVHASAPSGTSTGKHEVRQIPVQTAIKRFPCKNFIGKEISSLDDIVKLEKNLDTDYLGGNIVLAFSYALMKYLALEKGISVCRLFKGRDIPRFLCKIVGGGKHAGGPKIQEFLVFSRKAKPASQLKEISEFFHEFSGVLAKKDRTFNHGRDMEGGWATNLDDAKVLGLMRDSIDSGFRLELGLDIAANSFYSKGKYSIFGGLSRDRMIESVLELVKTYKLRYVEDPLMEEDYSGFAELSRSKAKICGDDIFVTSAERLKKVADSAIAKPNQVGGIGRTMEFVEMLKMNKMDCVFSHRSQETEDTMLSHLAVGLGADMVKIGISGSERTAKLNEFLRIYEETKLARK